MLTAFAAACSHSVETIRSSVSPCTVASGAAAAAAATTTAGADVAASRAVATGTAAAAAGRSILVARIFGSVFTAIASSAGKPSGTATLGNHAEVPPLIHIESAHAAGSVAVTTPRARNALVRTLVRIPFRRTTGTTCAAVAAPCADARTAAAAAVTAAATRAGLAILVVFKVGIFTVVAMVAAFPVTACGLQPAVAEKVERVARRQFNTRTATRDSGIVGFGTRASNRFSRGDVEIHCAPDGQTAAADGRVGETEVARGVIVRRGACRANRVPCRGTRIQGRPVR